jgi:hypothetical protein
MDTTAMDTAAAATAPGTVNMMDVAGRWTIRAMPETGDSTLATYELMATSETTGWTVTLPGGTTSNATVRADGDSLIIEVGPHDSVLRPGQQVTTQINARVSGTSLSGNFVERSPGTATDTGMRGRVSGTKNP